LFLIAEEGGTPIGQVRCQLAQKEAVLSVALAPEHQGRGLGPTVIRSASDRALTAVEEVHAFIRPENAASRRAFLKAGYFEDGIAVARGCPAVRMVYRR
jgi:RimJ/RimL family protein N-acetyltransferase